MPNTHHDDADIAWEHNTLDWDVSPTLDLETIEIIDGTEKPDHTLITPLPQRSRRITWDVAKKALNIPTSKQQRNITRTNDNTTKHHTDAYPPTSTERNLDLEVRTQPKTNPTITPGYTGTHTDIPIPRHKRKKRITRTYTGTNEFKTKTKKHKNKIMSTQHRNTLNTTDKHRKDITTQEQYSNDTILHAILDIAKNKTPINTLPITPPPEMDNTIRTWELKLRQIYLLEFTLQHLLDTENLKFHMNKYYFDSHKPPLFYLPQNVTLCIEVDEINFLNKMKKFYSGTCDQFTLTCVDFIITTQIETINKVLIPEIRAYYFLHEFLPFPQNLKEITQYIYKETRIMYDKIDEYDMTNTFTPTEKQLDATFSPRTTPTHVTKTTQTCNEHTINTTTQTNKKHTDTYVIPRKQLSYTPTKREHSSPEGDGQKDKQFNQIIQNTYQTKSDETSTTRYSHTNKRPIPPYTSTNQNTKRRTLLPIPERKSTHRRTHTHTYRQQDHYHNRHLHHDPYHYNDHPYTNPRPPMYNYKPEYFHTQKYRTRYRHEQYY